MPLYEYECKQCHKHTEKIQKFSDAEITECPHCGGKLERVVSAAAISFKGGGWFKDGYGSAKPKAAAESSPCNSCPKASSEASCPAAPAASAPAPGAASSDKK